MEQYSVGNDSAVLALSGLAVVTYFIDQKMTTLELLTDYVTLTCIGCGGAADGFFDHMAEYFFGNSAFLNFQTDELYD